MVAAMVMFVAGVRTLSICRPDVKCRNVVPLSFATESLHAALRTSSHHMRGYVQAQSTRFLTTDPINHNFAFTFPPSCSSSSSSFALSLSTLLKIFPEALFGTSSINRTPPLNRL